MDETLLWVNDLTKVYKGRRLLRRTSPEVQALRGVNLSIMRGRILAVVGESGSGKSTLARCIVRLEASTSGQVCFAGTDLTSLNKRQLRPFRPRMQLILQGSSAAINPGFRGWEVVAEPLRIQGRETIAQQKSKALECMEQVGLSADLAGRLPHQLSGGQLQRLAIARALVLNPEFLVLDEPFTGLDVSIQAQIANLLLGLQRQGRLTYMLILHDLVMASILADEIAILHDGRIVEIASPADIAMTPIQNHTKALVAAAFGPAADTESDGGRL
jgi:ABC-type oligopeptide transport system ATPase subunit